MSDLYPRFEAGQLQQFLEAVDRNLDAPAHIRIIGGTAAAVGYDIDASTNDIDTFESLKDLDRVTEAAARARQETALDIHIGNAGVADLPHEYETRLVRVMGHLQNLQVFVPERHDLVLSKVVRWEANDAAHVIAINRRHPLDEELLVERYLAEMSHAMTRLDSMDINFTDCIERLFGEAAALRTEKRVASYREARR